MGSGINIQGSGLRVGVTGHRAVRLAEGDLQSLTQAAVAMLAAIDAASEGQRQEPNTLVTCMADGADAVLTDAATAAGWRVEAVLPFPRATYRRDFAEGDVPTFDRQLASADRVFELPGLPDEPDARAYERAGAVMLAQIDLLIGVWDGQPGRGPGGTAQVINDALARNLPVVLLDPQGERPVEIAWLPESDVGLARTSIDYVPRHGVERLPDIAAELLSANAPKDPVPIDAPPRRHVFATAYPLFMRLITLGRKHAPPTTVIAAPPLPADLRPLFDGADAAANASARMYRSGFILNFGLAAVAVLLSMMGLALSPVWKPLLIFLEVLTIAGILFITHVGNRRNWHRRWMDSRYLAERVRCLSVSLPLGDMDLRGHGCDDSSWADCHARIAARASGLPNAVVDPPYLQGIRDYLLALLDSQIAYLTFNEIGAHTAEHRLHRLCTLLFATTAVLLGLLFCYKLLTVLTLIPHAPEGLEHGFVLGVTMVSAAFPALGAALYGIRMQGDFAGTARRDRELARLLHNVRREVTNQAPGFDRLQWHARRVTDLLTADLASWSQTYRARPLMLPG